MIYRRAGSGGPPFSVVGLGSYLTIGDRLDLEASSRCIHAAIDQGVNFFDTADNYADGEGERTLGRVLADTPRDRWLVGTKCFFPWSDAPTSAGLSRKHLTDAVHRSLRNLRVDEIDLFQCHRFDPETPLEETLDTLDLLVEQGKILYWGIGRCSAVQIESIASTVRAGQRTPPLTHQTIYSLLRPDAERDELGAAHGHGIGTLVYGALGQGVLSGKYSEGARPRASRGADPVRKRTMYNLCPEAIEAGRRLAEWAEDLEGVTPAQAAIAWCLRRPEVLTVIVGASDPSQVLENTAAADLGLQDKAFAAIEGIFKTLESS